MRTSSCPACRPRAFRSPRHRSRPGSSPSTSHSAAACAVGGLSRLASPRLASPRPTHAACMCTRARALTRAPRPNSHRARTRPNQVSELRRGRGRAGQPRARGGQGHHRHARAQPAPAARQLPRAVDPRPRSGARRASRGGGRRRGRDAASCSRAAVALIEARGQGAAKERLHAAACQLLAESAPQGRCASESSPSASPLVYSRVLCVLSARVRLLVAG